MNCLYLKILALTIFCTSLSTVYSQEQDPDARFTEARTAAGDNEYDIAIQTMQLLVNQYPQNADYTLYLARLYFWKGDYVVSRKIITPLITSEVPSNEALKLAVQLELLSANPEKTIELSNRGLLLFPDDSRFYYKNKILALEKLGNDSEALLILDQLFVKNTPDPELEYLKTRIMQKKKNTLMAGYLNTSFSDPGFSPWHLASLEYIRKEEKIGFGARINYARTFGNEALQGELDVYPKINNKSYLHINVGISDKNLVFPNWKAAAEYYYSYKNFTTSVGARYLKFTTTEVPIFTAHIAYNHNEYQWGYRSFLVSEGSKIYPSHNLSLRRSFTTRESFVQLDLQYGTVPYFFFVGEEFFRINSYRVGVNARYRVTDHFFIHPVLLYEREEFLPGTYRNRWNIQLQLSHRF